MEKVTEKMLWSVFLALIFLFPISSSLVARDIVINELMSSNATTIADEDGDYEDWIELYNAGAEAINLSGYGLSDDYSRPFRWVFPDIELHPGEFLLVWASGKDRRDPGLALHTNFSISMTGEEVLITRPGGARADELMPVHIPADLSYGRQPDGMDSWYFFDKPTPGQSNTGTAYEKILAPPVFSQAGGIYEQGFSLTLSHENENATIVFTMDGSIPDIDNTDGTQYVYKNSYPQTPVNPEGALLSNTYRSFYYEQPIAITDRSGENDRLTQISSTWHYSPSYFPSAPVKKGRTVRARAFSEGAIPSQVQTHTYFIGNVFSPIRNLPVASIVIQEDALFDYYDGIYVAGVDFDNWRKANRFALANGFSPSNYRRRGIDWEYPANIEYFDNDEVNSSLNQLMGLRIHGGWTRSFPNKSLRLYARSQYGNEHFEYPFFGINNSPAFKRLLLRNSGNDAVLTMFRDAAVQQIVKHMQFDTQDYQPVVLFINGEYWGIHNLRERYDKYYLERVYGVDAENLDILTQYKPIIKEGDAAHYLSMITYISNNDMADDQHYEHVTTLMDVENFADYNIAQIFAANTDWPGNNIDFWRLRTEGFVEECEYGHDGRWRWLMYDTDFGFGFNARQNPNSFNHNTLRFATHPASNHPRNPPEATFLLRRLLNNGKFRVFFINRFADQLNTAFLPERTVEIITDFKQQIEAEIIKHIFRWKAPQNYQKWNQNISVMLTFVERRPHYQIQHLNDYFKLNGTYELKLDVSNQLMGYARVNSIKIADGTTGVKKYPYPWTGKYFKGIPIELEAIPKPGYVFSHWEGDVNSSSPIVKITPVADVKAMARFTLSNEPALMYFWLFDTSMPNDTPLEQIDAHYGIHGGGKLEYVSCFEGYPFNENHPKWRKASMERRNQPTPINYQPEANDLTSYANANMRGLQVRQPFTDAGKQNTMIFHVPTTGFSDIVLRFAAKDEGAADYLIIDYAVDNNEDSWTDNGLESNVLPLSTWYKLFEIDFSEVTAASNNTNFRVRFRFGGKNMAQDAGNRVTFNNISMDGIAKNAFNIYASASNNGTISPSGVIPVYEHGNMDFLILPKNNFLINDVVADNESVMESLTLQGDTAFFCFQRVQNNHTIHVNFIFNPEAIDDRERMMVFPNPANELITIVSLDEFKQVKIRNISGQLLFNQANLSSKEHTIQICHLPGGVYFVSIHTNLGISTQKVLIVK